ncbi:MAG TPA: polysaccharide deacetylase family protein [Chryseolinea sp.]|nr:polysaccharide deacetylase family protein [Chryseolinea sp.]
MRLLVLIAITASACICCGQTTPFVWPAGKKAAISLSFDDARASQVNGGTELLDRYGAKATFYVVPGAMKDHLKGWKSAVASGHEIGNHSLNHPCSGNFPWSREKAIENYTLDQMRTELQDASKSIEDLLGVKPVVFAYPCGQTFIGRGTNTKSYVPLVADLFLTGRGWKDEGANDPAFCDFAQLTGIEMDGKEFDEILPIVTTAIQNNQWIVFAGHEMGDKGDQTTRMSMLAKLIEYAQNPANGLWLAPVGTVATYVQQQRK